MANTKSLLDELNADGKEFNGGGSATARVYFTKFKFQRGLKVYPPSGSGIAQSASWFPYNSGAEKPAAVAASAAFVAEHNIQDSRNGKPARPQLNVAFILYKDTVQNGAADKWTGDQFKNYPIYPGAATFEQVVQPAIEKCGLDHYGDYYGKFILVPDPVKKEPWTHEVEEDDPANPGQKVKVQKTDQVAVKVWVPDEIYPTEAAMITAAREWAAANQKENAATGATGSAEMPPPPEYPAGLWNVYKQKVIDAVKAGGTPKAVADTFAIQEAYVIQMIQSGMCS